MATKIGSLREKLLSTKGYSDIGLGLNKIFSSEGGEQPVRSLPCRFVCDQVTGFLKTLQDGFIGAVQMGKNDPRNIVFAAKMGLALTLISLLVFLKEPFYDLGRYSVWAILTVVVVFEFSIGNSPCSCFTLALKSFFSLSLF